MANVSAANKQRIYDMADADMDADAIATNLGLSRVAVGEVLRQRGQPPEPKVKFHGKGSGRRVNSAVFKDWAQEDYDRFVKFWQETPNIDKACEAEGLEPAQIKYVVNLLKRNGVPMRGAIPSAAAGIDFEALKATADRLISDQERQRLEAQRQRAKTMRKGKRKSKPAA